MTIKIGLYIATAFPAEDPMQARLNDLLRQVRNARDRGFVSLWAGQHFLTKPLQMPQPVPLLARLLAEAEGMQMGPNILIMPVLNPVAVAEESVTMDLLTGGKYVLGVGLGYREEEYQVFNTKRSERVGRMVESIEVMRRLWTEETVSHEGLYYSLPDVGLGMKPLQTGGAPIWIAASSDPAIERAARIGDAWLITFYPSITLLKKQLQLYYTALKDAGKEEPKDMPILKECYISPDHHNALSECRGPLQTKYNAYAAWGQDKFLPENERFNQPFDEFIKDRFIIGDPRYVREEIQRYYETLGVNHFIMRIHWPGLEGEKVMRTIDLMGEHVIPYLD